MPTHPRGLLLLAAAAVAGAGAQYTVQVDAAAGRTVSPLIYGGSFVPAWGAGGPPYTLNRWGGNAATRYNYQLDTSNQGSDWFFLTEAHSQNGPDDTSLTQFIDQTNAHGASVLLTVPTIGWTPRSRDKTGGFSVKKYGPQRATECTASNNASWCDADAGNGVRPDGTYVTGNDPTDTSVAIDPEWVAGYVQWLQQHGHPVGLYALDNEPVLWSSTHRDVHPQPLGYDELWQRTRDYAAAVKRANPEAVVFGPVVWGWCAYFGSAKDNCTDGADRRAHGGTPLLEWYLQQVRQYRDQNNGLTLVDVLDVHYYPQAAGVTSDAEDAATAGRRLRSPRSLWDPTYTDESWINQPVQLLPRLQGWIASALPSTRLSLSEYSFGDDDLITGAIANLEALGLFAEYGVWAAARWGAPKAGSRTEAAFRLLLNYDGQGGHVGSWALNTTASAPDSVAAFAYRDPATRAVQVLLLNKLQQPAAAAVTAGGAADGTAAVYQFDQNTPLRRVADAAVKSGSWQLQLPAWSATLCVVAGK